MSILAQKIDEPALAQGDLLKDVPLFVAAPEGQAQPLKASYLLVISRDCNALREEYVAVVPIVHHAVNLDANESMSFDALRRLLADIRDGAAAPDRLYLGTIDSTKRRYSAQLDKPCTIKLPTDKNERANWVGEHRIARLAPTFKVSLPRRLFGAFGRVGFDDHDWFCTADLELLVARGRMERSTLQAKVHKIEGGIVSAEANSAKERQISGMRQQLNKAQTALREFEETFLAYEKTLAIRVSADRTEDIASTAVSAAESGPALS